MAPQLEAELAAIVALPNMQGSAKARSKALTAALEPMAIQAGIKTRVRQIGITESDLDRLPEDSMLQIRLMGGNNPGELTQAEARLIYAADLMANLTARLSPRFPFTAAAGRRSVDKQEIT